MSTRLLRRTCPFKSQKATLSQQAELQSPPCPEFTDSHVLGKETQGAEEATCSPVTWIPLLLWSLLPVAKAKPSSHLASFSARLPAWSPISLLAHVNPCCSVNSHTDHMTTLLHASVAFCLTYNPYSLPYVVWLLPASLTSSSVCPF